MSDLRKRDLSWAYASQILSSEAILDGKTDCRFPKLMKVDTDDTIHF